MAGEPGARSPHEALYYYQGERLVAVRAGRWKLMMGDPQGLSHMERKWAETLAPESLFNLERDPGEARNVLAGHPDVADRLRALAETARDDIGDAATGRTGRHRRPAGRAE